MQAGAIGRRGEALVLDMGEPVRIADVARRSSRPAARTSPSSTPACAPGEKLHEELLGDGETDQRPFHPLITHTSVPALPPEPALAVDPRTSGVVSALATLSRLPATAADDVADDRVISLPDVDRVLDLPDQSEAGVLAGGTERSTW